MRTFYRIKIKVYNIRFFCNSFITILLLFIILLAGCRKDEYDLDKFTASSDWEPDVALPLIYSSLDIDDIFSDHGNHYIEIDANKFTYLIYQKKVTSANAVDIIIIPNQFINSTVTFNIPGNNLPIGSDYITTYNSVYEFYFTHNEIIDSIYLKSAYLIFNINSNLNYDATIDITLPTVTKNGVPFSTSLNLYAGGNPFYALNLDGCVMKLGVQPSNENNKLTIKYTITVHGNGSSNNSPYNIYFNEYFSNIQFQKIYGYLGQFSFDAITDTLNVKLFNNAFSGFVDFENPHLYLMMSSSFGMPFNMHTSDFLAKTDHTSTNFVDITGPAVPDISNPYLFPPVTLNNEGQTINKTIYLDKNNSSIYNAMLISPRYIYCKPNMYANPAGVTNNFALDTSRFSFNMILELPLHGQAGGFVLQDTVPFEFEDIDKLQYLQFNIDITNNFPVEAITQVYFINSSNNVLDSLLNPLQTAVVAATPGPPPDYLVTHPERKYLTVIFNKSRIHNLVGVKKLFINACLNSYNSNTDIVKIYSFYKLDVKLSVRAKFSY